MPHLPIASFAQPFPECGVARPMKAEVSCEPFFILRRSRRICSFYHNIPTRDNECEALFTRGDLGIKRKTRNCTRIHCYSEYSLDPQMSKNNNVNHNDNKSPSLFASLARKHSPSVIFGKRLGYDTVRYGNVQ